MASTYSPLLRFELIASGEQAGLWGNTENVQIGTLVEQAIAGVTTVTLSSTADYTLTTLNGTPDEARAGTLVVTGAPGGTTNVVVPALQKQYQVRNATPSTVVIKTVAQVGGVSVQPGGATRVFCDGVNVYSGIEKIYTTQLSGVTQNGGALGIAQYDSNGVLGTNIQPTGSWNSSAGAYSLPTGLAGTGAIHPTGAIEMSSGALWTSAQLGVGAHMGLVTNGVWTGGAAGSMKHTVTGTSTLFAQTDTVWWFGASSSKAGGSAALYSMMAFLDANNGNWTTRFNLGISDRKFKGDIKPIKNALAKVCKLNGVTYKRLDAPKKEPRATGLIAQDVQKVLPEAVRKIDKDGTLAVAYGNLAGVFVEAFKDVQDELKWMKQQHERLLKEFQRVNHEFEQSKKELDEVKERLRGIR